jgi:hypothetical protein
MGTAACRSTAKSRLQTQELQKCVNLQDGPGAKVVKQVLQRIVDLLAPGYLWMAEPQLNI